MQKLTSHWTRLSYNIRKATLISAYMSTFFRQVL